MMYLALLSTIILLLCMDSKCSLNIVPLLKMSSSTVHVFYYKCLFFWQTCRNAAWGKIKNWQNAIEISQSLQDNTWQAKSSKASMCLSASLLRSTACFIRRTRPLSAELRLLDDWHAFCVCVLDNLLCINTSCVLAGNWSLSRSHCGIASSMLFQSALMFEIKIPVCLC